LEDDMALAYMRILFSAVRRYDLKEIISQTQRVIAITSSRSTYEIADQIADQLGETDPLARKKIRQIVEACGVEQTQAWLEETLAIEAGGGMMVDTGERRRTPGGVFFYLIKGRVSKELRRQLFPYPPKKHNKKSRKAAEEPAAHDTVAEPISVSENLGRLEELRMAEREVQERVAAIQALPPSERSGLMSAMKELQRIRGEMKALNDDGSPA
jgi:hypothetical protein